MSMQLNPVVMSFQERTISIALTQRNEFSMGETESQSNLNHLLQSTTERHGTKMSSKSARSFRSVEFRSQEA